MQREQLIEAIFATMQQVHRTSTTRLHALMGEHDISLTQLELMLSVKHQQPVSVKDLAAQMRLTPGAVTQLLEGVTARNYVERQTAEYDRRITNVTLTRSGTRKLKALCEHRKATLRQIMETLDSEELAVMLRVQEKLLKHFEAKARPSPSQVKSIKKG